MTTTGFELILPFLRPIQHLILDPEISEIMVNGAEHVFIERSGRVEAIPDLTLSPKSLEVAVRNIARRLGDDISEEKLRKTPARHEAKSAIAVSAQQLAAVENGSGNFRGKAVA